jgi:hypothetical protein
MVDATPDIPPVALIMGLAILIVAFLDARRYAEEPAFKWLVPGGFAIFFVGLAFFLFPVVVLGATAMAIGLGLSKNWRTRYYDSSW